MNENKLTIYTDGSANNLVKPHFGGWAYAMLDDNGVLVQEDFGGAKDTTNNRMELMAIQEALWNCPFGSVVSIVTDSLYAINILRGAWSKTKNVDIIDSCMEAIESQSLTVDYTWVKGHSDDEWNIYVDEKAKSEYYKMTNVPMPDYEEFGKKKKAKEEKAKKKTKSLAKLEAATIKYKDALSELVFSIENFQSIKREMAAVEKRLHKAQMRYDKAFSNAKKIIYNGKLF